MSKDPPTYIMLGQLRRDFLITPDQKVIADQPGGNLLYGAEGATLWLDRGENIGLLARVGEDYPRAWVDEFRQMGYNTSGIKVLEEEIDLRYFCAYQDLRTVVTTDPVAHFSRLGLTMPRALLGYKPPKPLKDLTKVSLLSLRQVDFPENYRNAHTAHLCPLDYVSHSLMPAALRQAGINTITLDPGNYMKKEYWEEVRSLVIGLTAFLPSEEELTDLFSGRSTDVLEMMEAVASWGVDVVVVKRAWKGQLVLDAASKCRYEIPAYPSKMMDPTGAGDVFSGGFMVGLAKTGDPLQAVLYGNTAASIAVEGSGPYYTHKVLPGLEKARLEMIKETVREL